MELTRQEAIGLAHSFKAAFGTQEAARMLRAARVSLETAMYLLTGKAV